MTSPFDILFVANAWRWALQVLLIVGATGVVLRIVRADDPRLRLRVWHTVLLMSLLLPFVQPRLVAVPVLHGAVLSSWDVPSRVDWLWWSMAFVIAGVVVRAMWLAVGLLKLQRLRRGSYPWQPLPDWWGPLARDIGASADVGVSRDLRSAVTFGIRPASILVPQALRAAPDAHQRAVLAHELTHVARKDWAWVLGEQAIRTLFWCHPAIRFALAEAQLAREEVVDRCAIAATGSREGYLEALVAAAAPAPAHALGFAPHFLRRRQLATRIRRLLKENPMSKTRLIAVAAVLGLTVPATMLAAGHAFPLIAVGAATTIQQAPPPPPPVPPAPPALPRTAPQDPLPPPPPPTVIKHRTIEKPKMPPPPPPAPPAPARATGPEMPPPPPPAPPPPPEVIKHRTIEKPKMPPPPPPAPPAKIGRGGGTT